MPHLSLKSYGADIERHAHDFHQIVLPRRGRLAMEIAGRAGAVTAADPALGTAAWAAVIPAGESHAFQAGQGDQFVVLDLTNHDDGIEAARFLREPYFAITPSQQALLHYLDQQVRTLTELARIAEPWCQLLLGDMGPPADAGTHAGQDAGTLPGALQRALDLISQSYATDLRIAEICRQAGLSESRLFILFRRYLGSTPHAYLSGLRLDAAQALLAQTDLPIVEIAWRCGLGDQASLTRQMRRQRGITPAAYRRQRRC
jgi:AraC-like DNA-binding protein